jgi:hypothetical protein
MDRHLFLAAPWADDQQDSATLSVYYDINSGHYECDIDNRLAGVIKQTETGQWIDVSSGETTELASRAGLLIDKRREG